jgi:UDP-2,4-diacetamido-2,4,6-trideoxy-beta-L-altropyranose hydrolase
VKLLIRADGNVRIGTGHIMRCLSLAQGVKRAGGEVMFAVAEISASLEERFSATKIPFAKINFPIGSAEDAAQTIQLAREQNADWIVADGYSFAADFQKQIKQAGFRLLLFDDYGHAESYCADLILNQNIHANAALYEKRAQNTRLLLGTHYALLRDEFLAYRNWKRTFPPVARKLLVTLGGADPDNVTGKVIEALRDFDLECKIVVGGSNPHLAALQSAICHLPSAISLIVDARNMPELMAWADIAVAAGGTTSWELAFMGVPTLMFVLAENQREVAEALGATQMVRKTNLQSLEVDLRLLITDFSARKRMSELAQKLVDGLGVSRVISHLRAADLNLRPVRAEDCRQIWEWANDPDARAVSIEQQEIPWADHMKWFSSRVNSPSCFFYIAANSNEKPIGQIRFDVVGSEAVLSVSLAKESRGRGYGAPLIVGGAQRCFADSHVTLIRAFVKPTNESSLRAFEKSDFVPTESVEFRGQTMRQFILKR